MVLETSNRSPVALFFGTSAQRVNDAVFLQMAALLEHIDVSVVALLENDNSVSQDLRRRAANRLTTVPVYRRDEADAISRNRREVLGRVLHCSSSVTKANQPSTQRQKRRVRPSGTRLLPHTKHKERDRR